MTGTFMQIFTEYSITLFFKGIFQFDTIFIQLLLETMDFDTFVPIKAIQNL
jgi:hypothetical protein